MALRLITAGESHGPGLTCIVEGLPAGLQLTPEDLNEDMSRRQLGHGRGGRMKIERDTAEVTGGVRHGRTLGSPVALRVDNRDYANWEERMNPWPVGEETAEVHLPRPGHADLVGTQKYKQSRVRPRDRGAGRRRGAVQGVPAGARRERVLPRRADRLGACARARASADGGGLRGRGQLARALPGCRGEQGDGERDRRSAPRKRVARRRL